MSTTNDFDRRAGAWLADGPTELNDRVLDAALREVHLTQQRRALRAPWRFPGMSNLSSTARVLLAAAVLLLALGGGTYLIAGGGPVASPTPPGGASTAAPSTPAATGLTTQAPTVTSTAGWITYTSAIHDFSLEFPADWSFRAAATRTWQVGDALRDEPWSYADSFVSPDEEQIALLAWEMPAGGGIDLDSIDGLRTFARTFCAAVDAAPGGCDAFAEAAMPMCLNAGGDTCRAALLVPTSDAQYAFFMDWTSVMFTDIPDRVTVVVVAREDSIPAAARYGGAVALLKLVLTTMDVWTPGLEPTS